LHHNGYNIICSEKRVVRGHRVCKNTKGGHEPKNVEKHCILEEKARPSTKYILLKVAPEPNKFPTPALSDQQYLVWDDATSQSTKRKNMPEILGAYPFPP